MIAVVDTSALIVLLTTDERHRNARLMTRLSPLSPHLPDIVDVEFLHALRGLVLGRKITTERAEHARFLFEDTPKVRFPSHLLGERIWSLRHNMGAYDATFIALAEALDAPLITCDAKQAAATGHQARVEVFG